MKKQRMQISGCSMLAAALIGLLPIAAIQAQDRTMGQEPETGTMGSQGSLRQGTDDMQMSNPDERGAQGPMREDVDPAAPSGERPLRQDMELDSNASGAQGPARQDTESDPIGPQGPVRQDMETSPDVSGVQGPMRARNYYRFIGTGNPYIDPRGIQTVPYEDFGPEGPMAAPMLLVGGNRAIESNPFIDPYHEGAPIDVTAAGMGGPVRSDEQIRRDLQTEMKFHNYVGETNPIVDTNPHPGSRGY